MHAPSITTSSRSEREAYIHHTYHCISNCDTCGICKMFLGKQPEIVFKEYIEGKREYLEIASSYSK